MSKSVNFYMKTFNDEKWCRSCHEEIPEGTPVVTFLYRTESKDLEMATCSECCCEFLDQEIEYLESLKRASQE